jgi:uncharacterized small protein (DUF1192 family)
MSDDIVKLLRHYGVDSHHDWIDEAADEIDRLRAEVAARTAERDEARRLAWSAFGIRGRSMLIDLGWDCFDAKEVKP